MPERCTKCKTGVGQVKLGKRALKCYRAKNPNCSADDLFCKKCNDYMEDIVAREVEKQKKRKFMERRLRMSLGGRSSNSSTSGGFSFQTIVERIAQSPPIGGLSPTPSSSRSQRQSGRQQEDLLTSPEIQYTQSQSQPTPRPDPIFGSLQDSSQSNAGENQPVEPVWHEYEEDDSDDDHCSTRGPTTSAAVAQPIVRKRKTAVVFADERIIPIYNQRRDFGG